MSRNKPGAAVLSVSRFLAAVFVIATLTPAVVWAEQGPLGGGLLSGPSGGGNYVRYGFDDAFGAYGGPALPDHRVEAGIVVSSSAQESISMSERFGHFGMSGDPIIPNAGYPVPRSLWSEQTGARYEHALDGGKSWGAGLGVGSASDRLFNSIRETVFHGTLDLRVPSASGGAWIFLLSYSNNRYFLNNVPLPGVAYEFRSDSGRVRGAVGLPFAAVRWKISRLWDARFSLYGPRRMTADFGRRLMGSVRAHGGFDWGGESWLPAGRSDYYDALNFERKRVYLGLTAPLGRRLILDVSGGRQFDQYFYEGRRLAAGARAGLPPCWYIATSFSLHWD